MVCHATPDGNGHQLIDCLGTAVIPVPLPIHKGSVMAQGRFGFQPARVELFKQRKSIHAAAAEIGCSPKHLENVVRGRTHPSSLVRILLPEILGVPLEDLFTKDILAKEYDPRRASAVKA
jgi:hypothetical protein